MSNSKVSVAQIDALLPQTQCGECGYPGCRPYAKAIAEKNEGINLCPPGGVNTLQALANLLQQDPSPYLAEAKQNTRPPAVAKIREAECIGCTKCIKVCPVDAILGSGKQMHSIIATECTGCELCIPACPVDCIDLLELEQPHYDRQLAKQRYDAHNFRLARDKQEADNARIAKKRLAKQKYVQAALNRVKAKKT